MLATNRDRSPALLTASMAFILTATVITTGCGPGLKIPESAQIKCTSNADCTSGYVCITTTGLCAVAATVDHVPPGLEGTVTPNPTIGRDGTVVEVHFKSTKPLSVDPVVTAQLGGGSSGDAKATFVKVTSTGSTEYTYRWIAHSGDVEGTATVSIEMVDRIGNPGTGSGGSFVLDFTPPKVLGDATTLSHTHARAGDTQAISFVTNEAVTSVSVKVGAEDAVQASSNGNQYAFNYVIPSSATEGETTVVAHLEDAAGNFNDVRLGTFVIDRTPPAFTGTGDVTAGPLRAGDDVRVRLDFNEPVGDGVAAIGVQLKSGSTTVDMLRAAGSAGVSSHWEFLHTVKPGEDGNWSAVLHDATDAAGNTLSTTTLTGTIKVDTTAPSASVPTVPSRPLKNGDTLSVSFTTSETLSIDPIVTIAGAAFTRAGSSVPPAYVFTRTVDKTVESEGGAPVLVDMVDGAGNRGSATLGTVLYDFTNPGVVAGSPALALTPPSGAQVTVVSAVTRGSGAVVTFTANEILSAAPIVTASSGATTLSFAVTGHPTTAYVATLNSLPASPVQGQYTVTAHLVDVAGNAVDAPLTLVPRGLSVDTVAPAALTATTQNLLVYKRNPWGSRDTNGRPLFQLVGEAGAVEAGNTIVAHDSADTSRRTELGRKVAPSNQAGAFTMDLQQSDNEVVYVTSVDPAGNESAAADVKNVQWTATLNSKVAGDTIANPHAIFTASSLALPRPGIDPLVEATDEAQAASVDGQSTFAAAGWTQVISNGSNSYRSPNARTFGPMVYDAARGKMVLFGGINTNGEQLGDTWEWDGQGWQNIVPPHSPSARFSHAMTYDSEHGRIVLFGGERKIPGVIEPEVLADTWVWNGADWRQLSPDHSPAGRVDHAMTFDSARNVVVLFGGATDPHLNQNCQGGSSAGCDDTWEFDGNDWSKRSSTTSPPGAYRGALAYDASRGVSVFFGGTAPNDLLAMNVWEWNGTDWSSTPVDLIPPVGSTMTWDPDRGRTLLFGGNANGQYMTVVWEWDGVRFSNLFPDTAPDGRKHHSAAYDTARRQYVVFSGEDEYKHVRADTWEWDGALWIERGPASTPIPLQAHSMTFDSARGRVLMAGDYESAGQWEWDGTRWSKPLAAIDPGIRYFPGLAFDLLKGWTLMFGGLEVGTGFFAGESTPRDDTWTYSGGNHWNQSSASGPPARYPAPAIAYHAATGQNVLVISPADEESGPIQTWLGGTNGWQQADPAHVPVAGACLEGGLRLCGAGKVSYDPIRGVTVYVTDNNAQLLTWEWDGEDWTDKTPATNPPSRQWPSLTYDAARGRTVLFGGISPQNQTLSDTWEWDGTSWTERRQAIAPANRFAAEMTSDTWRSRVTLYGGTSTEAGSCGTVGLPVCSDTWTMNAPEERGSLVVQFDARRAAKATNVDPALRTVNSISLTTAAGGDAATGVRAVQAVRPGAPEEIPDNTKPAGLTQKLYQSRACRITSTEVVLRMNHEVPEGLQVTLTAPSGTSVKLFDGNATENNQKTRFPNLTQPVNALTAFAGQQGAGYWKLNVTNSQVDNHGTLDGWAIDLGCSEPTDKPGAAVFAWDPSGAPWDDVATLATSTPRTTTFDRTWTSPAGTTIDGWNNGGLYRFAVAPQGAAGARDGSAQLDYVELTLSYRRQ